MEDLDSADTGNTANSSICSVQKEAMTLKCVKCGFYCGNCIGRVLDAPEASEVFSDPECKSEQLDQPVLLRNVVEKFRSSQSQQVEVQVFCTNCLSSAVHAVKTCLHCEVSVCEDHLRVHSKSAEHVLVEPTTSVENRKCPVHKEVLKYYCSDDSTCICVSCCLIGKHKGHEVESLVEASGKKKSKWSSILKMVISKKELIMKRVENLQEHKLDTQQRGVCLSKRILKLLKDIRAQLDAMEETILNDITKRVHQVVHTADDLIKQLELKGGEHDQQMAHIEKLCSLNDPFDILLQEMDTAEFDNDLDELDEEYEESTSASQHIEEEYDNEEEEYNDFKIATNFTEEDDDYDLDEEGNTEEAEGYNEEEEMNDEDYETEEDDDETEEEMEYVDWDYDCYGEDEDAVGFLDEDLISNSMQGTLAKIMHSASGGFYVQETSEVLLDLNTAASNIVISEDLKTATCSSRQPYPETPERFSCWQVLSSTCFSSGRHYWKVEASQTADWSIGIAYASIDRKGCYYSIGYNNKSWCLSNCLYRPDYFAVNDSKETMLPFQSSCQQIGVYLDYDEGRLSFYELSNPVKHLHTFTTTFSEPVHAAFYVWCDWVKIIS
ncbi:E3 ubiquitin/ISG15 ligase TRIM25-like [Pseudophryne corroboree]|uniref:E3 ubiquitin/ISG15 ligase TRIM25-like n=1 Tax=Pseudophryne corroboree TaxID=495146 RepID=UPI00308170A3